MFWNFWGFFCLYPMDRADDKEQHNTGLEEPGNLSLYPFPVLLWCVWDFLAPLLLFPPVPHYLVCLMSAFSSCPLPECLVRAMSSQQHLMLSPTRSGSSYLVSSSAFLFRCIANVCNKFLLPHIVHDSPEHLCPWPKKSMIFSFIKLDFIKFY